MTWGGDPEQQTGAEQKPGHKRKPCTDVPPNIAQEGARVFGHMGC